MKKLICLLLALGTLLSVTACGAQTPAGSGSGSGSGEEEKITLTLGVNGRANVTEWQNNKLVLWLEEVTGYDINVQVFSSQASERATQVATMVAAGEPLPDVMYYFALSSDLCEIYGRDGYINDVAQFLDDEEFMAKMIEKYDWDQLGYVEKYAKQEIKDRWLTETRDSEGHLWAFPTVGTAITDQPRNMLFINKAWLDKLGLEMPHTIEELEHVLTEFINKDPNGNGKADEMGMLGSTNIARGDIPSWLINNYIYLNDVYMFDCDDDGKIYLPYDRDEYREGIKLVNEFYDKGLIAPMTWTIKEAGELPGLFTPADEVAKIGVWAGHPTLRLTEGNPVIFDYVGLLPLDGSYAAVEPLSISMNHHLGGESKHPKEAFEVLYALSTPEGARRARYGEPGVDWVWEKCPDECPICHGEGIYGDGLAMKKIYDAYAGETDSTFANAGVGCHPARSDRDPEMFDAPVGCTHFVYEPDDPTTWKGYRSQFQNDHAYGYMAIAAERNPKNMVYKIAYTTEENERMGNSKTDIQSYAKEMRAKFCTGEIDINDDAVWKNYVDTIHSMGWDTVIECTQSAYDRMHAND